MSNEIVSTEVRAKSVVRERPKNLLNGILGGGVAQRDQLLQDVQIHDVLFHQRRLSAQDQAYTPQAARINRTVVGF